jgi:hypothetical protein
MNFYKKIYFLKSYQFWFKASWKPNYFFSFVAFLHIKQGNKKNLFCFQENSHTLEIDLKQDIPVIYSNFAKQVRQQTTQAIQEGITYRFQEDIKGFETFFNDFATNKGIFLTSERRLREMMPYLKLVFAIKNDTILAAHSYIFDREVGIVRHFHSSTKIADEQFDHKIIGKANKFLTSKCIEHFKNEGFSIFDFGGVEYPPNEKITSGIYNYKKLFGGNLVTCYNYYTPLYYILKLAGKYFWVLGKKTTV